MSDSWYLQAVDPYQAQGSKTPLEYLTEADFNLAAQNPKSGIPSAAELQDIKGDVVGVPVGLQWLSNEQLEQGGYTSWREFRACHLIAAW